MLQESWVAKEKSSENVVSHIMSIREKMAQMRENFGRCKPRRGSERAGEDSQRRCHSIGLVIYMSSSALTAQWQGPYKVVKQFGKVNYLIDMHARSAEEEEGIPY